MSLKNQLNGGCSAIMTAALLAASSSALANHPVVQKSGETCVNGSFYVGLGLDRVGTHVSSTDTFA
nr:hypothetical protein [Pseudomonadota bacterium]